MKKFFSLLVLTCVFSSNFALAVGRTPLQEAIFRGDRHRAIELIHDGAKLNVLSETGKTALDYAIQNLGLDIDFAALLIDLGAKTAEELRQH